LLLLKRSYVVMADFHRHVSVSVAKYVRITFIRKNSVAYVK